MNIYLVVEGPVGEKQLYTKWVPLVNPNLRVVTSLEEVVDNNIVIYSGGGYPNYFEVISNGVEDVKAHGHIDRLVIAVDSENMSYEEKRSEIDAYVKSLHVSFDYRIVVQHFCLETWALGNQMIVSRNPTDPRLREYLRLFNVLRQDPELLPDYPPERVNRSQFAALYLKRLLNEKYRNLTYSKSNPLALLHRKYYERVKARSENSGHLASFKDFLGAFV